ncbi:unnamed protein product, partial [Mesorhabditis spiculigera]
MNNNYETLSFLDKLRVRVAYVILEATRDPWEATKTLLVCLTPLLLLAAILAYKLQLSLKRQKRTQKAQKQKEKLLEKLRNSKKGDEIRDALKLGQAKISEPKCLENGKLKVRKREPNLVDEQIRNLANPRPIKDKDYQAQGPISFANEWTRNLHALLAAQNGKNSTALMAPWAQSRPPPAVLVTKPLRTPQEPMETHRYTAPIITQKGPIKHVVRDQMNQAFSLQREAGYSIGYHDPRDKNPSAVYSLGPVMEEMRIQVQVGIECIVVSCTEDEKIHTVAERTIKKLRKLKPELVPIAEYTEIRRTIGNSLLDPEDLVGDILKESDYVIITLVAPVQDETPEEQMEKIKLNIEKPKRKIKFDFDPSPDWGQLEKPTKLLVLDGCSLKPEDLVKCERGICILQLSLEAEEKIKKARDLLEKIVVEHKTVYGVSTGFGTFSNVLIDHEKLKQLQINLIRSHSTGYGQPLSPSKARMLLALRINVLAKGYSGISLKNLKKMIAAFNAFCVSYVPQQGTVGCSGDLCPLAHLALGLLGEGKMWSPITGWDDAAKVLKANHLEPMDLGPKEGLALINGTQMVTALGAYAVERAGNIARQADVIAALTLDVLKGTTRAYDADIHRIRPHKGQIDVARRLRSLLHSEHNPSGIAESHRNCHRVQDAYTLRCVPQVHGVVHDTIEFVRGVLETEMNSATDNPLVFADREEIISGGNFHGEYPAKVLDYLAIAVAELAQISERRLERLVNHDLSNLPTFLTPNGGLNSGYMTVQLAAASLVSENKVLCHPSSADSIPTSCNQEDHVSMGGFAARKALIVVEHVEAVLAMELMAACQGIEFLKPLQSTAPLNKVYQMVRTVSPPLIDDRFMQPEIERVIEMVRENKVWECVAPHLKTLEEMEDLDPDALRSNVKTPTGAALGYESEDPPTDEDDAEIKQAEARD